MLGETCCMGERCALPGTPRHILEGSSFYTEARKLLHLLQEKRQKGVFQNRALITSQTFQELQGFHRVVIIPFIFDVFHLIFHELSRTWLSTM